ncbi:cyclin L1 [Trypanosoma grayi]|uniref:cyclin L1 n=1 Tax=Trypanosoma grayi TaxID=71804 RepID=UPI0004F40882|nr:cyclin L1 [Trypanosoma grayi]KEG15219.1 cyclin L1 [Trypanosoma grayi]
MPLPTGWVDRARRCYCAYGADLIRTGCILLSTSPSVTYRAGVLFQRFQKVAEKVRQKRGDYQGGGDVLGAEDSGEPAGAVQAVPYVVPPHAGTERPSSGVLVLGDLYAPLQYCLEHLHKHDDIAYLAAACILIAAKVEGPSTQIRCIVDMFMRLNQRRRDEPVIEQLRPPPERYDDFKACVIEAEELLLQALGFQTFVECPFKYAIFFLGVIVENEEVESSNSDTTTTVVKRSVFSDTASFVNPALRKWLEEAVSWLNDIPRSLELFAEDVHVLALCALLATQGSNVIECLPDNWTLAFGVERSKIDTVLRLHRDLLGKAVSSESINARALLAELPAPCCKTEATEEAATLDTVANVPVVENTPVVPAPLQQTKPADLNPPLTVPSQVIPIVNVSPFGAPKLVLHPNPVVGSNPVVQSLHGSLGIRIGGHISSMSLESHPTSIFPEQPEKEMVFEDLNDARRRWRQEEEEKGREKDKGREKEKEKEKDEKHTKQRRRSSSRRKRHRSGDRRRSRSNSRRREDSRERRKRRYSSSAHKDRAHRSEQQMQHQQHHRSKGDHKDDRQRQADRQRNDTRHQRRRR